MQKKWAKIIHWVIYGIFLFGISTSLVILPNIQNKIFLEIFILFNGLLLTIYIPKLLLTISLLFNKAIHPWTKRKFQFITYTGVILSLFAFVGLLYGILVGRFNAEVNHIEIKNQSLPAAFDGLKIVQISDLHVGSLGSDTTFWAKSVALCNKEKPDLVVMTGDMIDNFATELTPEIIKTIGSLQAKSGKYAILGNHDYGDYSKWKSAAAKKKNFEEFIRREKEMGFRLLTDEHTFLNRGRDTLVIAGVQNWSKPPFHCYGNLSKTMQGTQRFPYVLLLSHDPNHWMAQAIHYPNIRLMLAGHTHGMQIGIDRCGIHWSPAQWMFKQWDGLYTYKDKALYVNRGLGYLGIPIRLGMPPEITVITLKRN
jgi:predicted MPP superfamily phosphohydrolase